MTDGHLDGKIYIVADDGMAGVLNAVRARGKFWFVTQWHPQSGEGRGWPAVVVHPPENLVDRALPGRDHRYVLNAVAPAAVLAPECPAGMHHGYEVQRFGPPRPKELN